MTAFTDDRPTRTLHVADPPQWSRLRVVGVWALVAVPTWLVFWVIDPALVRALDDDAQLARWTAATVAGVVWPALVMAWTVHREHGTLRWRAIRDTLWLVAPQSPQTGAVGGALWWLLVPALAAVVTLPALVIAPIPHELWLWAAALRPDSPALETENAAQAVVLALTTLTPSVVGLSLLLPRMRSGFGRFTWLWSAAFVACVDPLAALGTAVAVAPCAFLTQRYRSAWWNLIVQTVSAAAGIALLKIWEAGVAAGG